MSPETTHTITSNQAQPPLAVVRHAIEALNALDAETADHLSALAFVLIRVARADGRVCGSERRRMEEILVKDVRIPAAHAAIVTEIACHRAEVADSGHSYAISRGLRTSLDLVRRRSIVALLSAVAEADGRFCTVERHEISQLAGELGIDPSEVVGERE